MNTLADRDLSRALRAAAGVLVADASDARTLPEILSQIASLDALIAEAVAAGLPPMVALEQAFGGECAAVILDAAAAAIGELNNEGDDAAPPGSQSVKHERGVAVRMADRVLQAAERARVRDRALSRRLRTVPRRGRPRARRAGRRRAYRAAAAAVRDGPPPGDAPPEVTGRAPVAGGRVR